MEWNVQPRCFGYRGVPQPRAVYPRTSAQRSLDRVRSCVNLINQYHPRFRIVLILGHVNNNDVHGNARGAPFINMV